VSEILGRDLWVEIGQQLRGTAGEWWEEHRSAIEELAKDEARAIFIHLRRRDLESAKFEIVARMSRDEWELYRDGTTKQLKGIAVQRAKMLDALRRLGILVAEVIGSVALERLR
jgi:hypothetical protein